MTIEQTRLKEARISRNLTQTQLAEKLNLSQQAYQRLEAGAWASGEEGRRAESEKADTDPQGAVSAFFCGLRAGDGLGGSRPIVSHRVCHRLINRPQAAY